MTMPSARKTYFYEMQPLLCWKLEAPHAPVGHGTENPAACVSTAFILDKVDTITRA
jgi:hypothetical protein